MRLSFTLRLSDLYWMWLTSWFTPATVAFGMRTEAPNDPPDSFGLTLWKSLMHSLDAGALGAIMSGSGPTVVALARHMGDADRLADAVPGSFVVSGPPQG